uniref:DNA-directed RNA polymerase n=1 Tax=Physcomitrium patens TaxID=3218 RepID=A0A2K1K658_PHYPA|nr:hypothetical protein PHYPA_011159 [Physcomitrium patens]
MICPTCKLFDSIEKIKGKKVCSNYKDHARIYTFDPKRMCLVDKKEPNYTKSASTLKGMFSTLSNDQIKIMGYDLSNPKDFIMKHIHVVLNCIRLSSGPKKSLARLYSSILRNNGNASIIYKEYYIRIEKDSFENNEGSLINRISGNECTFKRYILDKRNKHYARAVITLDLNIDVDEIGVFLFFYSNLKVERDGDYVLLNRQPFLQKKSLIAFRARMMLDSYTIRINPSVCPTFNADFDGDEMNIFYTSSYLSKAECDILLVVDKCILLPQNSMPTVYAIQDIVAGAFMMHKMNKILRQSIVHDCIMMLHAHLDATNICTSKDLKLTFIQIMSNGSNLAIKSLTSTIIKNLIKSIFISNGGPGALMFLKIVDCWLLEEGLSIGYDDCANKVGIIVIIDVDIDGQQWIGRKRLEKVLLDDRILAWCSLYDNSLEGQGFVNSSYLQGLNSIEYIFYCQRGRKGVINTGINTFDVGYI